MKKNILVILCHPDSNSFCGSISQAYAEGARSTGSDVHQIELGKLKFDPILWHGYNELQELEPDLVKAQELILWSNHIVFIYPNWWGSMPALMKGFFDRIFLPGYAYNYGKGTSLPEKLLAGRTAHLIVSMDTPAWYNRWALGRPGRTQMKRAILEFCGIKVVQTTEFAPVRGSTEQKRSKWIAVAKKYGKNI